MSLVLGTATGRFDILRQQDLLHDLPLSPYLRPGETRRVVILSKNTGGAMYQVHAWIFRAWKMGRKLEVLSPKDTSRSL